MSFPTIHVIFGLIMMVVLTGFVLQFTSDPTNTCHGVDDEKKCLVLMDGMKSLIYFSWSVYIGGIVVFTLLTRKRKEPSQTFDAGWEPVNTSSKESGSQ